MLPLVITLCLLALGLAVPVSANPRPCCMPRVFEGNISITAPTGLANGSYHLDVNNNRLAQLLTVFQQGQRVRINILLRGSDNATYIYNPDSEECLKLPMGQINNCLSNNSRLAANMRLGINPSLDVNVFTVTAGRRTTNVAVTEPNCVPVHIMVMQEAEGELVSQTTTFYDLAGRIRDPRVFNVPPYCREAKSRPPTGDGAEAMMAYLAVP